MLGKKNTKAGKSEEIPAFGCVAMNLRSTKKTFVSRTAKSLCDEIYYGISFCIRLIEY